MKRKTGRWVNILLLTVLCVAAFACTPNASAETELAAALAKSKWSEYKILSEAMEGDIACAVAQKQGDPQPIFLIGRTQDGVAAITDVYPQLLPAERDAAQWNTEVSQTDAHGAIAPSVTIRYDATKESNNIDGEMCRLVQNDHTWRLDYTCVSAIDGLYSLWGNGIDGAYDIIRWEGTYGYTTLSLNEEALSPDQLSMSALGEKAKLAVDTVLKKHEQDVLAQLSASFDESTLAGKHVLAWAKEDNETIQITAAILSKADGSESTLYIGGSVFGKNVAMIAPRIFAQDDVFTPYYMSSEIEENEEDVGISVSSYDDAGTYIGLCLNAEGQCVVQRLSYPYNRENYEYDLLGFDGTSMQVSSSNHHAYIFGDSCYRQLSEGATLAENFDTAAILGEMQQALVDADAGEPPYFPLCDAEFAFPQPTEAELKSGTYDVYTGPGKQYYREANGKACVSTKDWVQVFGREGDWVLVQYRVSGSLLRFGYIHENAVKDFNALPELNFEYALLRQDNGVVTSNPFGSGGEIVFERQVERDITRLAVLDEYIMYAELTLPSGSPARMFAEIEPGHG